VNNSPKKFRGDLRKFADKLGIRFEDVVTKIALDMYANIIKRTPVDTGRARASWNLGIGSIDASVAPEGAIKSEAEKLLNATTRLAQADLTTVERIYITNNLPYIEALENGHSKQAPSGMLAITVAEFQTLVSKAVSSAKRKG